MRPEELTVGNRSGARGVVAISLAFALDALVSEPPRRVHPVALFGRFVAPLDRAWAAPRAVGALASVCLPLAAAGIAAGAVAIAGRCSPLRPADGVTTGVFTGRRSPIPGTLVGAGVLFVTTSRRMLTDTARSVVADTERDLPRARRDLRALAGRDSRNLSASEVRSAAVESAGENLADGLLAPLCAFAFLTRVSLPAAAGAAAWVKAVNTMDSMLGYRSTPTGWAPARLDDCAMWVPARLTAACLALVAADPTALRRATVWAGEPPSPNAGWPMATLAAALDVRLEKPGVYALGASEELPTIDEANRGIDLVDRAAVLAASVCSLALVARSLFGDDDDTATDDNELRGSKRSGDRDRRRPQHSRARLPRLLDAIVSRAPSLSNVSNVSRWVGWS
jgi:adenosylcobinamide-phosphate synthase